MKKLILILLLVVHSLLSFAQTITVSEKNGTYGDENIFGNKKYVKPGDSFIIKMILDEGAVDNFIEGEDKSFNLIADANFFTSTAGISYNVTASTDVISFGTVTHPNNHTIEQTVNISGQESQDMLEILDITVTIPNSLTEGTYDLKLNEDFVTGLESPVIILTVEYKKEDISVQNLTDEYITADNIKVQKGQVISTKININEPDGYVDYFGVSTEWNIDLNLPAGFDFIYTSEALSLAFEAPMGYNEDHTFDSENSSDLITNNGQTIHQGLNITGTDNRDQIKIENVHVQVLPSITEGTYPLQLAHDFIPGEDSPIDLLYFEYVAPNVNVAIPQNEEDKPCVGGNEEFTLTDIPEDMEYYLVIDGEFIIEEGDMVKVHNGDTYAFSLGDRVKVREKYMTDPFVESDEIVITAAYFKSMTIEAVSGDSVFCPGAPVDFRINTSCGSVDDFELSFKPEAGEFEDLNPTPEIVDQSNYYAFTYIPPASGTIKVVFNGLVATMDLTVLPDYTSYDLKDYYAFPVNDSAIDLMNLEYNEGPPFATNNTKEVALKLGNQDENNLVYAQNTTDYLFYRFDVPYDPFPGSEITDSLYFDRNGIYKGAGIPNFVKLYFGKYYSEYTRHCFDSTTTAVYIIRDDIFIPQTNFCSNDNQTYEIEINTELDDYLSSIETDSTVYKFATYSGFDIIIDGVYNDTSASISTNDTGSIIPITPSEWVNDGSSFKIIAKAQIELRTYTEVTCAPQWNKFNNYYKDDTVLHNSIEYRAKRYISGSGISSDTLQPEFRRAIGPPIVIYITPGVHDYYWEELDSCRLGTDYSSVNLQAGYANKTFDIFDPKTDGVINNLDHYYCISNENIQLTSNYHIDSITGDDNAIYEQLGKWYFMPEKILNEGSESARKNIKLYYKDDHGCLEDTTYVVHVNKNYNVKRNPDLNLEDRYCIVDQDFEVESDYDLLTLSGLGVDSLEQDPWSFNPFAALAPNSEYAEVDLYMEFRDPNKCWYDSTFSITIDKNHNVKRNVNLSIEDTYCIVRDDIELSADYNVLTLSGLGINTAEQNPWYFNPAVALDTAANYATSELYMEYEDPNGCWYDSTFSVTVDKTHNLQRNVNISIEDRYCIIDNDFEVTADLDILKLSGMGIDSVDINEWSFNPFVALDTANNYVVRDIYMEYEDQNQCWYDSTFSVTIDKNYNVQRNVDLNIDPLYCPADVAYPLVSNFIIDTLIGNGIFKEPAQYVFNPAVALGQSSSIDFDVNLFYTDNSGCMYDTLFEVVVDQYALVDSFVNINNLDTSYCGIDKNYALDISNDSISTFDILGYGIIQTDGNYFYNAEHALLIANKERMVDTISFSYLDEQKCPYTKKYIVKIDSAYVNASSDLIFDTMYCAINKDYVIENKLSNHLLQGIEGFGVIPSGDTGYVYNPQKMYDHPGFSHADIYTNLDITDRITAQFEDLKQCPYKKQYTVHVIGNYEVDLSGELTNINDEYCQYDDSILLIGSLYTDSIKGLGVYPTADSAKWFFNPAHEDFTQVQQDVNETIVLYYRDMNGCPWYREHEVDVWARPEPGFTAANLCENDFTKLTDTTYFIGQGNINTRDWVFGDLTDVILHGNANDSVPSGANEGNTTGTNAAPAHRYPGPGIYDVTLRVKTDKGCEYQKTDTVIIGGYPEADFTFDSLLSSFDTWFYNHSTAELYDTIVESIWYWDDQNSIHTTPGSNGTTHNFDNNGVHDVQLTVTTQNGCTSFVSKSVPVFPYIEVSSEQPYVSSFENPFNGWLDASTFDSTLISGWKYEEVSENVQSYPNTSGFVWRTGDPDDEIYGEDGWIESPGFELSELAFPVLSIDIYQSLENGRDGAVVQYTLNDGDTWHLLGDTVDYIQEGVNWYNQTGVISNPGNQTITEKEGWSMYLNQWQTARFPLDKVKEEARARHARAVRFRVAFASDEGNGQGLQYDGFAFDNFRLTSRSRVVLLEQFINTAADYNLARSEEQWLNEFLRNNPEEVVGINYHSYIADHYDTLYYLNTPDISSRSTEYGAYLTQLTMVDGLHRCVSPSEAEAKAYYRMRSLKDKKFDINVETSFEDGALKVNGTVTKLVDSLQTEVTEKCVLRIGLVQKEMEVDGTIFKNVMVELLPVGIGNVVEVIPANAEKDVPIEFEGLWYPDNVSIIGQEYRLVVYVQGIWGADEVHQVWFRDLDSNLIPQVEMNMSANFGANDEDSSFGQQAENGTLSRDYLNIYPVPTQGNFYLDWGQQLEYDVNYQITSMSGQTILNGRIEKGTSKQLIEAENIAAGVYLIILYDAELKYLEKRMLVIK